ncbi:hypothetical protein BJ742DRAFT_740829 [Cladochytrium replicatum]|nr:hypothetical protein BJ742DRAFT_740829 [Cladochytrium replicatum]
MAIEMEGLRGLCLVDVCASLLELLVDGFQKVIAGWRVTGVGLCREQGRRGDGWEEDIPVCGIKGNRLAQVVLTVLSLTFAGKDPLVKKDCSIVGGGVGTMRGKYFHKLAEAVPISKAESWLVAERDKSTLSREIRPQATHGISLTLITDTQQSTPSPTCRKLWTLENGASNTQEECAIMKQEGNTPMLVFALASTQRKLSGIASTTIESMPKAASVSSSVTRDPEVVLRDRSKEIKRGSLSTSYWVTPQAQKGDIILDDHSYS